MPASPSPRGLCRSSVGCARTVVVAALLVGCGGGGGGNAGTAGTTGNAGTTGGAGSPAAGTTGTPGIAGTTGTAGTTGSAGTFGGAGTTGAAGTIGVAGNTGAAGSGAAARGGSTGNAGSGGGAAGNTAGGGGGSASAGTTGAGGSGPAATVCNGGAPAVAAAGAAFPFPQHRALGACMHPPACTDADMMAGWAAYKSALIVPDSSGDGSLRVKRPTDGNDTVSEGISYGMLFAVYMNDKATFDNLWKYEQKHLDMRGLMNWHIGANDMTASGGANSATDADEDMAFALVMADKQWGGYTTVAKDELTKVAMHDFGTDGTIKGGDTYVAVNPSYLAPAFYRVFASYTGNARWTTIVEKSYELLGAAANTTTGLVPDWSSGRPGATNYTYDATRTPFRIALDYCWHGEPRAKMFSDKIAAFFAGVGEANIKDGYNLNGTLIGSYHNATFVGPAGAAAMAGGQAKLMTDAYTFVAAEAKASATNYYDRSWALFAVMMMTGNFVNLAGL